MEKFERSLKRKINLIIVSSLEELESNLLENIINGVVLFGGIEVRDLGCDKDQAR